MQDAWAQAVLLNARGEIHEAQGRPSEAEATFEQALTLARQSQTPALRTVLTNLARLARQGGKHQYAMALAEEATKTAQQIGDAIGELTARTELAETHEAQGNFMQAESDYRDLLLFAKRIKHRPGELMLLERLGRLLRDQQRDNESELSQAEALASKLGDRRAGARLQVERILVALQSIPSSHPEALVAEIDRHIPAVLAVAREDAELQALDDYLGRVPGPYGEALLRRITFQRGFKMPPIRAKTLK
jgi:tetratricopeptide (TPR) repeat protein